MESKQVSHVFYLGLLALDIKFLKLHHFMIEKLRTVRVISFFYLALLLSNIRYDVEAHRCLFAEVSAY